MKPLTILTASAFLVTLTLTLSGQAPAPSRQATFTAAQAARGAGAGDGACTVSSYQMRTSTRRFFAMPSAVALLATGRDSP